MLNIGTKTKKYENIYIYILYIYIYMYIYIQYMTVYVYRYVSSYLIVFESQITICLHEKNNAGRLRFSPRHSTQGNALKSRSEFCLAKR